MTNITELEKDIIEIKERNRRVESDKAWETSWTRRALIFVFTYMVFMIFFVVAHLPKPFVNSLVPAIAFVLSTLSISFLKRIWLKYIYK